MDSNGALPMVEQVWWQYENLGRRNYRTASISTDTKPYYRTPLPHHHPRHAFSTTSDANGTNNITTDALIYPGAVERFTSIAGRFTNVTAPEEPSASPIQIVPDTPPPSRSVIHLAVRTFPARPFHTHVARHPPWGNPIIFSNWFHLVSPIWFRCPI